MRSFFRLLPLTVTFAAVLLLVKVVQTVESGQDIWSSLFVSQVVAQESPAPSEEDAMDGGMAEGDGEAAEKPAPEEEEDNDIMGGFLEIKKKKLGPEDLIGNQLSGLRPDDRRFSPIELRLLQQLSARRKNIDKREKQLVLRENLLTQTEKRLDEKFGEMTSLKAELSNIIAQFKEVEETKIKSLVKIYENMKPKDAARIFDELEMPILMMVIDRMSEKKAAPILANMDPMKAKRLTVELAVKRKQEDEMARKAASMGAQ